MNKLAFALALALAVPAAAKAPDEYQVTGDVTMVTSDLIVVMKGKEKFEIARPADLKTDAKVGDKVTIKYFMTAKSVEVKPAPKKGK